MYVHPYFRRGVCAMAITWDYLYTVRCYDKKCMEIRNQTLGTSAKTFPRRSGLRNIQTLAKAKNFLTME